MQKSRSIENVMVFSFVGEKDPYILQALKLLFGFSNEGSIVAMICKLRPTSQLFPRKGSLP